MSSRRRPRIRRAAVALVAASAVTLLLSGCLSAFLPPKPETTSTPTGGPAVNALFAVMSLPPKITADGSPEPPTGGERRVLVHPVPSGSVAPGGHTPREHTLAPVHEFPSSHGTALSTCWQRPSGVQTSSVQGLASSQDG